MYPSQERFQNLSQEIALFQRLTWVQAHKNLRLLGLMTACIDLVPLAPLHMRHIQFYFLSLWQPHKKSLFALIPIKIWSFIWMVDQQNEYIQRICLYQEEPVVLWTDASEIGWEAHMDTLQIAREVECV